MILLYLITPILGSLRNYIKYTKLNLLLFIRTPLIYLIINNIFNHITIWQTLIYERWLFFIYKTFLSIYNNDYIKNKKKYIKKYNMKYK